MGIDLVGGNFSPLPLKVKSENVAFTNDSVTELYAANSLQDQNFLKGLKPEHIIYADPRVVIEKQRGDIIQHVDRRIQLFFTQLISVYRTPFHFTHVGANNQYGKGHNLKFNPSDKKIFFSTQGAHSSTLPALVAFPKHEWDNGNKNNGFVWLKHSHAYTMQNSTVELAKFVNQADSLIDGDNVKSQLRNEAIEIVNDVAAGKFDPKVGVSKFLNQFLKYVDAKLSNRKVNNPKYLALDIYKERIEEVIDQIGDPAYFDHLLGVKVIGHPREDTLREIVHARRYRLIQDCSALESNIAATILKAQNAMFSTNRKSLKSVDKRLRYVLLEDADPEFRRKLERLFCTSLEQLQSSLLIRKQTLRELERENKITNFRTGKEIAINNLKRDLRAEFRAIDNLELQYRAEVFKDLRTKLDQYITQADFAEKFKERYPNEPMSPTMVSRFESRTRISSKVQYLTPENQRSKPLEVEKGKKISAVFGIDPGLFLPGLFTSNY